jgi:tetratricopeptide (TPR) repeat protein
MGNGASSFRLVGFEDDATDVDTVHELDALLRAEGRKDDLRWLFARRVDVASDDAKLALYVAWATLEETTFDDVEAARALYEKAAERDDVTEAVLRSLARLLRLRARHADAAVVLERALDRADAADRDDRELELATLYVEELGRHADALAAVGRVLESRPTDEKARAILARGTS